ncbi:MAG TPA: cation:proton antiporter [Verrucomicrobiae bacterium]|nr:cation:proton antiporter [Verrucomicrobiae bacterium]
MKQILFCVFALLVFGAGMVLALQQGQALQSSAVAVSSGSPVAVGAVTGVEPSASLIANLRQNLQEPLTRLFLQFIVIIVAARICGMLAVKIRQPAVVGEMIAGILLGPSLLGWVLPNFSHFIFPASSLDSLRLFSQIGVCLFMFVVGMELDVSQLKQQARTAVLVSQASILFPYLLGVVTALFLFSTFAGPATSFTVFALFIGISMSITAFPVLARILEERGLTKSPLGITALICAAMNDVTAWCILALVVALAKAKSMASAGFSIGLVVAFVLVTLFWIKPFLPRLLNRTTGNDGKLGKGVMTGVIAFVFACALATDVMGIHALFGSFLAGVVMPARHEFREFIRVRLEHFSAVFLLPLFFAFVGLRTQVGLLNDTTGWLICAAIIATATVGKLGGAMVAARLSGVNWIDSFALGALMNTRGLVELIALNIGYDLGILSPRIFAMLVIMALVTTCMTGPLLTFSDYLRARKSLAVKPA